MLSGIFLILIGTIILLRNVGILPAVGQIIWPAVLIIIGLALILKKK